MSQDKGQSPATSLPDVLDGLQRPPGSPERVYQRSKDFGRAAAELDDLGGDLSRLLLQVHGPWVGDAEGTFSRAVSERPAAFRVVAAGYRQAGAALKEYAEALDNAQHTFDASRRLADADTARQAVLQTHDAAYAWEPFSPDRVRARHQLEAATQRLGTATVRTTGVLRTLESTLKTQRPQQKPEIFRGRRSSARQFWDELWDKGSQDASDLWEWHRFLVPWQARDEGKKKLDEYADDTYRVCTDPISYAGDEAYQYGNIEEFQAGNDARGWAGFLYNAVGGPRRIVADVSTRRRDRGSDHGRPQQKDKEQQDKQQDWDNRSACSPVG